MKLCFLLFICFFSDCSIFYLSARSSVYWVLWWIEAFTLAETCFPAADLTLCVQMNNRLVWSGVFPVQIFFRLRSEKVRWECLFVWKGCVNAKQEKCYKSLPEKKGWAYLFSCWAFSWKTFYYHLFLNVEPPLIFLVLMLSPSVLPPVAAWLAPGLSQC